VFVSVSDFRSNMLYYLELSSREDVMVTRHNKIVATVTNTEDSLKTAVNSLRGIFPIGSDPERLRMSR
jgi:hypothetical protein